MGAMRVAGVGRWIAAAVCLMAGARTGRAAVLTVEAPEGCVDAETLSQEVANLVGRPLTQIPDVDFQLGLERQSAEAWHLRLETIEHRTGGPEARHLRELDARSCPDLAEAAALAIAMSIRAFADAAPAPSPAPPRADTPPTVLSAPSAAPAPPRTPWRPALDVALAGDAGELPGLGLGISGGGAVRRGWMRVAVMIGWLPARDTSTATGGRFQLAFGAADACLAPAFRTWMLLGCAGGELGAYWATGLGVSQPESRTELWRAARAGLGAAVGLRDALSLVVQATAVFPLSRSAFLLNQTQTVYKPAPVAGRLSAGLEFAF